MSTLCYTTSFRDDRPPWHIFVINGVDSNQQITTWLVYRFHSQLANVTLLPNVHINTHLDPWIKNKEKLIPLLSAPTASKKCFILLIKSLLPFTLFMARSAKGISVVVARQVVLLVKNIVPDLCNKLYYEIHYIRIEKTFVLRVLMIVDLVLRTSSILKSGLTEVRKYADKGEISRILKSSVVIIITKVGKKIVIFSILSTVIAMRVLLEIIRFLMRLFKIRKVETETEKIIINAVIEIYWIARAIVSVPRLIMEELFETRMALPLEIWRGYKERSGFKIVWNDGTPMELIKGIEESTHCSLPTVLLTATTGAVRDHLRSSGVKVPRRVRTTLPVYTTTGLYMSSPTLLPLTLPTGELNAPDALQTVQASLEKIQAYPAKYLISSWILKHFVMVLPSSTLRNIGHILTKYYPLLLCYTVISERKINLWGHVVKKVFHLRQPSRRGGDVSVPHFIWRSMCTQQQSGLAGQRPFPTVFLEASTRLFAKPL